MVSTGNPNPLTKANTQNTRFNKFCPSTLSILFKQSASKCFAASEPFNWTQVIWEPPTIEDLRNAQQRLFDRLAGEQHWPIAERDPVDHGATRGMGKTNQNCANELDVKEAAGSLAQQTKIYFKRSLEIYKQKKRMGPFLIFPTA